MVRPGSQGAFIMGTRGVARFCSGVRTGTFRNAVERRIMLIVRTVVSRKTPGDGRLEIPASLADRLLSADAPLTLALGGDEYDVAVEEMSCTCNKAVNAGLHVHHFLASDVLKGLTPEANVSVAVDVDRGYILIDSEP